MTGRERFMCGIIGNRRNLTREKHCDFTTRSDGHTEYGYWGMLDP
jgi:hypothetical protein